MTEFDLIDQFFTRPPRRALLGVGDDAAIIAPAPDTAFVVTTDTMIEGRHFLPTLDPVKLGRRLVQVNLSDLAAMGAVPRYAMLSIVLPRIDEAWVAKFAEGLWQALDEYQIDLIGGNTTRGSLALTLTAYGEVPSNGGRAEALLRSGAKPGDELWVSGSLGDAGWALGCMTGAVASDISREQIAKYESPTARVSLGIALRGIATSCIDVSDGLISEANHIANASNVAIDIDFARIPTTLHSALANAHFREAATHCLLATGDAYELLFTAPAESRHDVARLLDTQELSGGCIGRVHAHHAGAESHRVRVLDSGGRNIDFSGTGWDHFG